MLHISAKVTDADAVMRALSNFEGVLGERIQSFLEREGAEMEKDLKKSLNVSARAGTGPRGGTLWEPSEPGEPPRKRTSDLQNAQGYRIAVNKSTGEFILDIGGIRGGGDQVKYQAGLEEGTSKTAPRPHLMPIVQEHLAKWPAGLTTSVKEAGKSAGAR